MLRRLFRRIRSFSGSIRPTGYLILRHTPAARDRSLPGKGITRVYTGKRWGLDGRLVEREARYDPYSDVAAERVVDDETGEEIVNKVESMRDKYIREGRWKPSAE